jgi:hypothetical protein
VQEVVGPVVGVGVEPLPGQEDIAQRAQEKAAFFSPFGSSRLIARYAVGAVNIATAP